MPTGAELGYPNWDAAMAAAAEQSARNQAIAAFENRFLSPDPAMQRYGAAGLPQFPGVQLADMASNPGFPLMAGQIPFGLSPTPQAGTNPLPIAGTNMNALLQQTLAPPGEEEFRRVNMLQQLGLPPAFQPQIPNAPQPQPMTGGLQLPPPQVPAGPLLTGIGQGMPAAPRVAPEQQLLGQMAGAINAPLLSSPLHQAGAALSGLWAGMQNTPNPVLAQAMQMQQARVQDLGQYASVFLRARELEESRKLREQQMQLSHLDRATNMSIEMAKSDNELFRAVGIGNLKNLGFVPGNVDTADMAKLPNYGLGNSDLAKRAGAYYEQQIRDGRKNFAPQDALMEVSTKDSDLGLLEGYSTKIQRNPAFQQQFAGGPMRNAIFPAQWRSLPPDKRAEFLTAAEQAINQEKIAVSAAMGAEGVKATLAQKRQEPIIQSLPVGQRIVDVQTRHEVNPAAFTIADMQAGGQRYVRLDEQQYRQWLGIQEARNILLPYLDIVPQLTRQPGANFGQALQMWAQTRTGQPNPGLAIEALQGSILRLAGAMQGSRSQLSDKDVQALQGSLPTTLDTAQSALVKIQTLNKLFNAGEDTLLGRTSAETFNEKLNQMLGRLRPSGFRPAQPEDRR